MVVQDTKQGGSSAPRSDNGPGAKKKAEQSAARPFVPWAPKFEGKKCIELKGHIYNCLDSCHIRKWARVHSTLFGAYHCMHHIVLTSTMFDANMAAPFLPVEYFFHNFVLE